MPELQLFAPDGIGEVLPGADLVEIILSALNNAEWPLQHDDILVVAQKIVSKSEGRVRPLSGVIAGSKARELAGICGKDPRIVELVLQESDEVIRCVPGLLLVRHKLGFCVANAGIDQSNLGAGDEAVLLLPANPDASAAILRQCLQERTGCRLGIIISDSFGRPWRMGTTGTCIGCAGIEPLDDKRGSVDRHGRELKVAMAAIGDQLAAAAALLMGEAAEGRPLVCIRGWRVIESNLPGKLLQRPLEEDLFRT